MPTNDRRILLTGASGFLGHYVLAELLAQPGTICRVLLRMSIDEAASRMSELLAPLGIDFRTHLADRRVELVRGALPDKFEDDALRRVDLIIHAAASTSFRKQGNEPFRSNVDGTRALLEAAARQGVRKFCLVSTAYAGGIRSGEMPEWFTAAPSESANPYERSKWLAEQMVLEWAIPPRSALVVRPSIIIGDRLSGRATSFGGIYLLARTVELLARAVMEDSSVNRHNVPLRIMGNPAVRPNLIPVCSTAKLLVEAALNHDKGVSVLNLVNPHPPSATQIKEWLEEYFDLGGGQFTELQWPWETPSRFEEGFYASGQSILDYFRRDISFSCARSSQWEAANHLVDRSHFHQCIDYACRHKWGRICTAAARTPITTALLDPAWYFEEYLQQHLPQSKASRVSGLTAAVRFVIEGPKGGSWTCLYDGGRLVDVQKGAGSVQEQFGFRVQKHAFDRIVRGACTLQEAYFSGEANMTGNILTAMKMVPVMEMFLEEFPVRNAA